MATSIGDDWPNSMMHSNVIFNTSTTMDTSPQVVYANGANGDGWTETFDYVSEVLNGRPFSVSNFSDDYIDMSTTCHKTT